LPPKFRLTFFTKYTTTLFILRTCTSSSTHSYYAARIKQKKLKLEFEEVIAHRKSKEESTKSYIAFELKMKLAKKKQTLAVLISIIKLHNIYIYNVHLIRNDFPKFSESTISE